MKQGLVHKQGLSGTFESHGRLVSCQGVTLWHRPHGYLTCLILSDDRSERRKVFGKPKESSARVPLEDAEQTAGVSTCLFEGGYPPRQVDVNIVEGQSWLQGLCLNHLGLLSVGTETWQTVGQIKKSILSGHQDSARYRVFGEFKTEKGKQRISRAKRSRFAQKIGFHFFQPPFKVQIGNAF
jgi:hypothetical protein